jgi:hypothetical protein
MQIKINADVKNPFEVATHEHAFDVLESFESDYEVQIDWGDIESNRGYTRGNDNVQLDPFLFEGLTMEKRLKLMSNRREENRKNKIEETKRIIDSCKSSSELRIKLGVSNLSEKLKRLDLREYAKERLQTNKRINGSKWT